MAVGFYFLFLLLRLVVLVDCHLLLDGPSERLESKGNDVEGAASALVAI